MTEWRPIDTAPKDGSWFLAYVPESEVMAWGPYELCSWQHRYNQTVMGDWVASQNDGYWCETDTSEEIFPTHWVPLPSPPVTS